MKKNTGNKLRLGIFVSLSTLFLIAAIYLVGKKQQLFNSTFRLSAVFRDINGLQPGSNVRFSGINIGIVEYIEQISDTTVRVDILINGETQKFIKKNAKAIIGSEGLMGSKTLMITPGSPGAKVVQNNDTLQTTASVSLDEIFSKLKLTADNAAVITTDLSDIMENIHSGKGTIGKLFMDSAFAGNIETTLINLKEGTGGFKQNMDAAGHNILLRGFLKKKKPDVK